MIYFKDILKGLQQTFLFRHKMNAIKFKIIGHEMEDKVGIA
jgi:hypothetical protein